MIIADVAFDALPPAEQAAYARIRTADGRSEWVRRTDMPAAAAGPRRLTEPELERLTPGERYSYSRQFDQKQFSTGAR
jgi:hypothetical protein